MAFFSDRQGETRTGPEPDEPRRKLEATPGEGFPVGNDRDGSDTGLAARRTALETGRGPHRKRSGWNGFSHTER